MALVPCAECGVDVSTQAQACPACGCPPPRQEAAEVVYFRDGRAVVTSSSFQLGAETYPVRAVSSVTWTERRRGVALPAALVLGGLAGVGSCEPATVGFALAVGLLGGALVWAWKERRPTYTLHLTVGGMAHQPITSTDRDRVGRILVACQQALAARR